MFEGMQPIRYTDIEEECFSGQTKLHSDAVGIFYFVGFTSKGDVVVEQQDNVLTIPEITWNMWQVTKLFEPETHIRYIKLDDLNKLHGDESVSNVELSDKSDMLYQYRVCLSIDKVYKDKE
jgi:hypothetical protein